MNQSQEKSMKAPLDPKFLPKKSFAFDKDVNSILSSLGTNHAYIDQWQTNRKALINIHMSLLNSMYQSISKELDNSIQKTDFFIEFLRIKSLQTHKFSLMSFKPIGVLNRNSLEGSAEFSNKGLMDPFGDIWNNMDSIHTDIQKKSLEFCNTIDQNLLKGNLLEEQRNFMSTVSKFKTKVLAAKKRLEKIEQECDYKYNCYSKVYEELVKELNIKKKFVSKKSLYIYQHDFLSSSFDHEILHKDFANIMIAFFREIWLKETYKKEKIKEILTKYYDDFKKLFKGQRDLKILDDFINELEPKDIVLKQFDIKNLLSVELIANVFENNNSNLDDLETFLSGFKLEQVIESELILGKFTCVRQMDVIRTKNDSWVYGVVILTKDAWLLILGENTNNNIYSDPQYVFDLGLCTFDGKNEDTLVILKEKKKGCCKKDFVHWIRFDSLADKEHFLLILRGG